MPDLAQFDEAQFHEFLSEAHEAQERAADAQRDLAGIYKRHKSRGMDEDAAKQARKLLKKPAEDAIAYYRSLGRYLAWGGLGEQMDLLSDHLEQEAGDDRAI